MFVLKPSSPFLTEGNGLNCSRQGMSTVFIRMFFFLFAHTKSANEQAFFVSNFPFNLVTAIWFCKRFVVKEKRKPVVIGLANPNLTCTLNCHANTSCVGRLVPSRNLR